MSAIHHNHPEIDERQLAQSPEPKAQSLGTFKCNPTLRARLLDLREQPGWSNNIISKRMGVNASVVSQYLSKDGCIYPGDVAALERKIEDLLSNEARRRASGVDTVECSVTEQIRAALEEIRLTNDFAVILAESGNGKTRGLEDYLKSHPTALLYRTFVWNNDLKSVEAAMFDQVGRKDYDGRSKRVLNTIRNMRGSDRLVIVDDAHKLTRPALQWWFDFHDATQCPIAFAGTFALLEKLEDDPQRFSRVGLHCEIVNDEGDGVTVDRTLILHLIKSLIPAANGETEELADLCEQVAKEHGHYRSVHKQLKLAVELRAGSKKPLSFSQAFRNAHTMLVRNYNLN